MAFAAAISPVAPDGRSVSSNPPRPPKARQRADKRCVLVALGVAHRERLARPLAWGATALFLRSLWFLSHRNTLLRRGHSFPPSRACWAPSNGAAGIVTPAS